MARWCCSKMSGISSEEIEKSPPMMNQKKEPPSPVGTQKKTPPGTGNVTSGNASVVKNQGVIQSPQVGGNTVTQKNGNQVPANVVQTSTAKPGTAASSLPPKSAGQVGGNTVTQKNGNQVPANVVQTSTVKPGTAASSLPPKSAGNNVTPLTSVVVPGNSSTSGPPATSSTSSKNGNPEIPARRPNETPERREDNILEESPQGRFHRFDEVLGKGGFKVVYKAYDSLEGCEVAWNVVKLIGIPEDEKKRIVNEVNLLYTLKHENILEFRGTWVKSRDEIIFITEILGAGSLKQFIKKVKVIRWKVVKRWCTDILNGLIYLHTRDPPVIHRDLKCDNIFINGQRGDLRIGDLGLSRRKDMADKRKMALTMAGTPAFMAPEFYTEQYDEKVDIYALGMCTLEMLTKEYPYYECANTAQIMKLVMDGVLPQSLEGITLPSAKDFITKCLAADPASRPCAEELSQHEFLKKGKEDEVEVKLGVPLDLKRRNSVQISETGKVSPPNLPVPATSKVPQPISTTQQKAPNQVVVAPPSQALDKTQIAAPTSVNTSKTQPNISTPAQQNTNKSSQQSPVKNQQGSVQKEVQTTTNSGLTTPAATSQQVPTQLNHVTNNYSQQTTQQHQGYAQRPPSHPPQPSQMKHQPPSTHPQPHLIPPTQPFNSQQQHHMAPPIPPTKGMQGGGTLIHHAQDLQQSRSFEDETTENMEPYVASKSRTGSSDSFDPLNFDPSTIQNTEAHQHHILQQQHNNLAMSNGNHYVNHSHTMSHLAQQTELSSSTSSEQHSNMHSNSSFDTFPDGGGGGGGSDDHHRYEVFYPSSSNHEHQHFYATTVDDQHQSDGLQHQSSGISNIKYDYDTNPESSNEVNVDIELPISGDLVIVSCPFNYAHDDPAIVAGELCEAFEIPEQVESIKDILTDIRRSVNEGVAKGTTSVECSETIEFDDKEPTSAEREDPVEKEALAEAIRLGTKYDEGRLKRMEENIKAKEDMEETRRNKYLQDHKETQKKIELQRKILEDKRIQIESDFRATKLLKPPPQPEDTLENDIISCHECNTELISNNMVDCPDGEKKEDLGNEGKINIDVISFDPTSSQSINSNNGNSSPSKSNFPFIIDATSNSVENTSTTILPPAPQPVITSSTTTTASKGTTNLNLIPTLTRVSSNGSVSSSGMSSNNSSTNLSIGSNASTSSISIPKVPPPVDPSKQSNSGQTTCEATPYPSLAEDLFLQPPS